MKKIISLSLAIVLAFALAAPAMAITGYVNPESTAGAGSPYTNLSFVLTEAYAGGVGLGGITNIATNKAYALNGLVYFALGFTTPKGSDITMAAADFAVPVAVFTSDVARFTPSNTQLYGVSNTNVVSVFPGTTGTAVIPANSDCTVVANVNSKFYDFGANSNFKELRVAMPEPSLTKATTDIAQNWIMVGQAEVISATNGTIKCEILGDNNSLKFDTVKSRGKLAGEFALNSGVVPIYNSNGDLYMTVTAVQTADNKTRTYKIVLDKAEGDINTMIITTDVSNTTASGSKQNVTSIELADKLGHTYTVIDKGNVLNTVDTTRLTFIDNNGGSTAVAGKNASFTVTVASAAATANGDELTFTFGGKDYKTTFAGVVANGAIAAPIAAAVNLAGGLVIEGAKYTATGATNVLTFTADTTGERFKTLGSMDADINKALGVMAGGKAANDAVIAAGATNATAGTLVFAITARGVNAVSAGGPTVDSKSTLYGNLKTVYETIMKFFNFNYNAEGLLLQSHFAMKFSTYYSGAATQDIKMFTGSVVVPDEQVPPPQTGDASSTVGFVMIAMAIVAAAAVAYKKVRA